MMKSICCMMPKKANVIRQLVPIQRNIIKLYMQFIQSKMFGWSLCGGFAAILAFFNRLIKNLDIQMSNTLIPK